jgi:methyltransferase
MIYWWLLAATIAERVLELVISKRNAAWSFAQGGKEYGHAHYKWMVVLHTAFLICCVVEPWILQPVVPEFVCVLSIVVVIFTQALRWWVISTLGQQWNTRVIIVPSYKRVRKGPFLFLNHPNYLAVILELAALPLIGGAWITSLVFTLLNLLLLRERILVENDALAQLK